MPHVWSAPCCPSREVGGSRPILQMGKLRLRGLRVSRAWSQRWLVVPGGTLQLLLGVTSWHLLPHTVGSGVGGRVSPE